MQRDQVGLQAQLSRLMKVPGIVSAGVYDASNTLLAQAGATPSELAHRNFLHNYSATLSLGDNMTGNVVVTLETEKIEHALPEIIAVMLVVAVLGLLALLLLSRHFTQAIQQQREAFKSALLDTLPSSVIDNEFSVLPERLDESSIRQVLTQLQRYVQEVQTPSQAALHEAAAQLLNSAGGCAYLLLECHNLDVLQRQISRDRLRVLLDGVQQKVEQTARLYNVRCVPTVGSCIKLAFPVLDEKALSNTLLQAACCAHALVGVLAQCRDEALGLQLQWRLALDRHLPCSNDILRNGQRAQDESRSQWLCRQVGSGQLAVSTELGALLQAQEKLTMVEEFGEGGKAFFRITGLAQPQHTLVNAQVTQLVGT
jgi:uncharacterized membrane protein affecting hemolysin expression